MMKKVILFLLLFCSVTVMAQQAVSEAEIAAILQEEGIDPSTVNITQQELIDELMTRGVDLTNEGLVRSTAVQIVKERAAAAPQEQPETPPATPPKVENPVPTETIEPPTNSPETETVELKPKISRPYAIYGQQFVNEGSLRIIVDPTNTQPKPNYIVGIGDKFAVTISSDNRQWSGILDVDVSGAVSQKGLLPATYVKGMTYARTKQVLLGRFRTSLGTSSDNINITLSYSRLVTINIMGEVEKPGAYSLPAANTAFNALVASGGLTKIGSVRHIELRRVGSPYKDYRFI